KTLTGEILLLPPTEIGEYILKLSFSNHLIYHDFDLETSLYIGEKRRILIDFKDNIFEENSTYEINYECNHNVNLNIEYYLGTSKIEKPTTVGEYTIVLSYPEDHLYYEFREESKFIIYPEEQQYEDVEGIYHITGKVLYKTENISFIVHGNNVLWIKDSSLELNKSYEIVGVYTDYGTVLLKREIKNVTVDALEVTMMQYDLNKDLYLMKYIQLNGMVIFKNSSYVLKMEESGIEIPLNHSYASYYKEAKGLAITMLSYQNEYIIVSSYDAIFNEEEELFSSVLLFEFEEIADVLPEVTSKPFEISIQYLASSHPDVVDVTTLKVNPKSTDIVVTLKVRFYTTNYSLTKIYNVKVLKAENQDLMIYSIEMHQQYGDSTFIKYGDFDILIDAGDKKDGPYVNEFLKKHISSDNHLDMMIVTHCHSDHMGGLAYASGESSSTVKALDGIATIGTIVDYGHDRSTNALHNSWVSIRNSYIAKGAEYYPVYDCAKNTNGAKSHYQIDNKLSLDFIDTMTYALPSDNKTTELNIYSIAALLTYDNFKFFFAGDLEDLGEYNLYNNISNTPLKDITEENIVLYKAAHHGTDPGGNNGGKNGGNQLPFLRALKPDYFFASAAMCSGNYPNNNQGDKFIGGQPHPYIKCLANFLRFNDNVYFNGTNGTLEFITDGQELKKIHGFGATTNYLLELNGSPIDYASQADLKLVDTLWYEKNRKTAVNSVLGI
ncbi:MAG: MBL fold metallo-hydrolase, partial [Anaeroplasmataceae bacterium]|nr:MBL fold metallo-hydrolase [Anaeroplasmataceae bacterium]